MEKKSILAEFDTVIYGGIPCFFFVCSVLSTEETAKSLQTEENK